MMHIKWQFIFLGKTISLDILYSLLIDDNFGFGKIPFLYYMQGRLSYKLKVMAPLKVLIVGGGIAGPGKFLSSSFPLNFISATVPKISQRLSYFLRCLKNISSPVLNHEYILTQLQLWRTGSPKSMHRSHLSSVHLICEPQVNNLISATKAFP